MEISTRMRGVCLAAILLFAVGCGQTGTGRQPVLEGTSGHSLGSEAQKAASAVEDALGKIVSDPEEASELLRRLANRLNSMVVKGELIVG